MKKSAIRKKLQRSFLKLKRNFKKANRNNFYKVNMNQNWKTQSEFGKKKKKKSQFIFR